jgi:8-oxo-dGTP diphosphatase
MFPVTETPRSPSDLIDLHVVAAVIFRNGRVMAAKRNAGGPSSLKWEFPGGKVERDESPDKALIREIAEELGMTAVIREELGSYITELGKWKLRLHCFICDSCDEPTRMTAHSEIRWCNVSELSDLDWALPDVPAVEALQRLMIRPA